MLAKASAHPRLDLAESGKFIIGEMFGQPSASNFILFYLIFLKTALK